MQALALDATPGTASVSEKPIPRPAPAELLIRVHAVALNPVDALYTAHPLGAPGRTVGSDFAGTIEKLGRSVPESSGLTPDTRVAGFLQGACSVNERPGAFAEYLVVPWDLVWQIPPGMEMAQAATVSLCALTAAQGVYYRLGMPMPFDWEGSQQIGATTGAVVNVFVYGASTSLGLYAAQLVRLSAKASGWNIQLIGAASKARHEMLTAQPYGYDELVDYRDENWPEQIGKLCGQQGVDFAVDCISEGASVVKVNGTLGGQGRMAIFRSRAGGAWSSEGQLPVEPVYGAVWEGLGVEVQYQGFTVAENPRARLFAVAFYNYLSGASNESKAPLEPNPVRLMPGGLDKIAEDGFALLGPGSMEHRSRERTEKWMAPISAEKLVYSLA